MISLARMRSERAGRDLSGSRSRGRSPVKPACRTVLASSTAYRRALISVANEQKSRAGPAGLRRAQQVTEVSHQNSAGSQRAWLPVPIFTSDRLGGLPGQDRMRVLDKACERLGPGHTGTAHWTVFAAHAGDPARRGHPEQPRLN
jgi:hypothetical protein